MYYELGQFRAEITKKLCFFVQSQPVPKNTVTGTETDNKQSPMMI